MITIRLFILVVGTLCTLSTVTAVEFKGFRFLISILTGEYLETIKSKHEEEEAAANQQIVSKGVTEYNFLDFITMQDQRQCLYYEYAEYLLNNRRSGPDFGVAKQPIKVKCLPNRGNGTLQIVRSLKEVVTMLAPHGNNTKRTDEGNCALVLFYTRTCVMSATVAPHFNAVSRKFPDIRIGAIDAVRFHGLNTDFGIVGLPTIMLFHQGRPIIKFNDTTTTLDNIAAFVTKHTGLESQKMNLFVTSEDFHGPLPSTVVVETDLCLYLAWSFIVICAAYYFTKSKFYTQIIEMIKRNWRESEAQHEHN